MKILSDFTRLNQLFKTLRSEQNPIGKELPNNEDVNGVYNIVRKDIWVVEQTKQTEIINKI